MSLDEETLVKGDHRELLNDLAHKHGEEHVRNLATQSMKECQYPPCYNTKYKDLIKPYLNDPELLDTVLRSDIIKSKSNVIIGKTGACIYAELLQKLASCNSKVIRDYLRAEFEI
jgi:hypothetical protein